MTTIATMRRYFTLYVCPVCDREAVQYLWQEQRRASGSLITSGSLIPPQCDYCTGGDGA